MPPPLEFAADAVTGSEAGLQLFAELNRQVSTLRWGQTYGEPRSDHNVREIGRGCYAAGSRVD